jgi:O-methyltransferase involved in polyketide biosynthesis
VSDERVSPTAHYTGYVWARNGLSHPAFVTNEGRLLYTALLPANTASAITRGPTAEGFLLARHLLIDHLLTEAIEAGEVSQVIEIASGLSPRGWSFTEKYGDALTYIETDLPGMAARKREILTEIDSLTDQHRVVELDAFADDGPQSLASLARELDPSRGTAIVTEGLVNYFDTPAVIEMWTRFAGALRGFAAGRYLSDIHIRADNNAAVIGAFTVVLSAFVRGQVHVHFDSVEAAVEALHDAGFTTAALLRPVDYPDVIGANPNASARRVRVIDAAVAGRRPG